jgi:hypothetical protein
MYNPVVYWTYAGNPSANENKFVWRSHFLLGFGVTPELAYDKLWLGVLKSACTVSVLHARVNKVAQELPHGFLLRIRYIPAKISLYYQ